MKHPSPQPLFRQFTPDILPKDGISYMTIVLTALATLRKTANSACCVTHCTTSSIRPFKTACPATMNENPVYFRRLTLPKFLRFLPTFLLGTGISLAGVAQPPAVELTLSPDEIGLGSSSELTITIDNSANPGDIDLLAFSLSLPEGVIFATPANPLSECGGTITVEDGGSLLQFTEGVVSDSGTCSITAIVTRTEPGEHTLIIANLTSRAGESPRAEATLGTPEAPVLGFSKRFAPDLVPLGGRSTLIYTIENQSDVDAFHLSFNDFFPEGIAIATPPSVSTTCEGISITAINGTQAIEVAPDEPFPLPAGETCILTLDVVGIVPGVHNSISSNLTAVGVIGGQPVSAGRAAAQLEVLDPSSILDVSFSKEFIDNPVAPGGTGTLEFSITNNSTTDTLTNIRFTDDLEATLPGLIAAKIPTSGGTLVDATFGGGDGGDGGDGDPIITGAWDYLDRIENENGTNLGYPIDGSGNAWNSVAFDVATSTIGPWESDNAPLQTGGIDGFPGAPDLLFGIDAALNGENLITTYLFRNTFEITAEQLGEAEWLIDYLIDDGAVIYINETEIFRTPSMPAGAVETTTLSGLGDETATSTGNLNLSGILVEGTNSIAVEVHQNTLGSSDVGFQLQLTPAPQNPTEDDPFQFTEAWDYLDRIENENGTNLGYPIDESGNAWNSVAFDVATSTIGSWESEDAPIQTGGVDGFPGAPDLLFGIGAALNGENLITTYLFRNTFEITAEQLGEAGWLIDYLVDDGAVVYINGTEVFRTPNMPAGAVETTTLATVGDETGFSTGNLNLSGILVEGTNSIAVEVHQTSLTSSDVGFQLQLAPASQNSIVGFSYSDDTFNGTEDPEFAEGSLDPTGGFDGGGLTVLVGGQSGFFNQTPASSGGWSKFFNLDDPATVTISLRYRLLFDGSHEDDEFGQALLELDGILYGDGPGNSLAQLTGDGNDGPDHDTGWQQATFNIPMAAGNHTILLGAYNNKSSTDVETTQVWFDDIVIEVPEIAIEPCGPGSSIEGTDLLSIAGGTLAPGQVCSFSVQVSLPVDTPFGSYLNVTSRLTAEIAGESKVGLPASDTLVVEPIPPIIAKSFNPSAIPVGGRSTVTYTIDNTASALEAGDIAFTDIFPESLTFDPSSVQTVNCGEGGTYSFLPLTNTFEAGGSAVVPPGATCTISFDVIASSPGTYGSSTSELTTSLGSSPGASASLNVVPPPIFTQVFTPENFNADGVGTLTYTIDNTASALDATNLSFTNALPAGLVLSDSVNFFSSCVGGSVTAGPGSSSFSYSSGTVPAGASCILQVEVTSREGGSFINTTGDLTSSLGNSGPSTDTLEVTPIVAVRLSQIESVDPVVAGSGDNNLVYTISTLNDGPSTATGITISETLTIPTGVRVESIVPSEGSYEDGTWDLGTLGSGSSATLTVTLTVEPTAADTDIISSSATLSTVNETNVATETSTSAATSIITRVDLQITNTEMTPDPVTAGSGAQNLEYLITVTNNGPSFATNITLDDTLTLPPGVTLSATEFSAGTDFSNGVWSVGDLPVEMTALLRLKLTVDSSTAEGTDVITNLASVSSVDQIDANPQNDSILTGTSVVREVDFAIAVIESRDPVLAGFDLPGNLTHTALVTNNGPSDASNVVVRLNLTLPAGVSIPAGAEADWIIADLPRGDTASFNLPYSVSSSVPGGVDSIVTAAELASTNETVLNPDDDSASEATSVISPGNIVTSAGEIALDLQTALFKQTITITNNNLLPVPALRLFVDGLPGDVTVHNAQGESGGRSFLLYNRTLAPGESVELVVEYFQADASGGFEPEFEIELLDATEVTTAAEGIALNRIALLPNRDTLLEFTSIVGDTYTIQFSENGEDWTDVVPDVIAGANVTQWVDNGPPKTPSHPRTTKNRFYRVVHKSTDSN